MNADPKASVHSVEWRKIMNGDPVEINPCLGNGLKIMPPWTSGAPGPAKRPISRLPGVGSTATKEHHFMQTWPRQETIRVRALVQRLPHVFLNLNCCRSGLHAAGGIRQGALGADGPRQSLRPSLITDAHTIVALARGCRPRCRERVPREGAERARRDAGSREIGATMCWCVSLVSLRNVTSRVTRCSP